jgi:hypothetical protein
MLLRLGLPPRARTMRASALRRASRTPSRQCARPRRLRNRVALVVGKDIRFVGQLLRRAVGQPRQCDDPSTCVLGGRIHDDVDVPRRRIRDALVRPAREVERRGSGASDAAQNPLRVRFRIAQLKKSDCCSVSRRSEEKAPRRRGRTQGLKSDSEERRLRRCARGEWRGAAAHRRRPAARDARGCARSARALRYLRSR